MHIKSHTWSVIYWLNIEHVILKIECHDVYIHCLDIITYYTPATLMKDSSVSTSGLWGTGSHKETGEGGGGGGGGESGCWWSIYCRHSR